MAEAVTAGHEAGTPGILADKGADSREHWGSTHFPHFPLLQIPEPQTLGY